MKFDYDEDGGGRQRKFIYIESALSWKPFKINWKFKKTLMSISFIFKAIFSLFSFYFIVFATLKTKTKLKLYKYYVHFFFHFLRILFFTNLSLKQLLRKVNTTTTTTYSIFIHSITKQKNTSCCVCQSIQFNLSKINFMV